LSDIEKIKEELAMKYMAGNLKTEDIENLPVDDSLRIFICSLGSNFAFAYAENIDHGPHDETRNACSKDLEKLFNYVKKIDGGPRDDTRTACCKNPYWAWLYAKEIDCCPHEETKKATSRGYYRNYYKRFEADYLLKSNPRQNDLLDLWLWKE
jgi:hypothetical protein